MKTITRNSDRDLASSIVTDPARKLENLLAGITAANRHEEVDLGAESNSRLGKGQSNSVKGLAAGAGGAEHLLSDSGPIVQTLRSALPRALAIYAFGSQVAGTADAHSDLDLAVLVAGYAAPLQLWDLAHHLAGIAGCPVDLLDLRAASTVMQYQVLIQGKRLWKQGLDADLFECFVMGEKLSLDEARAGVLADIAKDGRVYGR